MRIFRVIALSIFTFMVATMQAMAQPFPPDPVAAPLDGFTFLLLAGGIAIGASKLREKE
ncbi:MAG: hypothetical protein H6601_05950 [Flavobacteriales bacterium]|nr:hypothetical protein [Flavobacteriales bacterium]